MEYYANILGNLLFSSTNPFRFSESPKLWQPISSLFQHQIQNNTELQTGNRTHQHFRQMRSGLFGRTPLRFQDGTVISPIRRCILNGICYGNGEAELLDSQKFCGSFRVKCASGHRKIVLRFHDGTVIFSHSPMHFEWNMLWEWRSGTVGFAAHSVWNVEVGRGIYHDGAVIFSQSLIQSDGMCLEKRNWWVLRVVWWIPCEICECEAEYTAPVPVWKCHLLQISDAFWTEFVNGMEKRNCRILTIWRRIPCERCKWAAEYSGGLRLCGGSSKSHDLLCCICGKEGRKIVTGGTESAFPISFCLHRLRKEGAMGILLDEPKYPVIDRAPSAGTTISNFNLADWLRVTAITSASIPVGYLAGTITSCVSVSPLVFWSL